MFSFPRCVCCSGVFVCSSAVLLLCFLVKGGVFPGSVLLPEKRQKIQRKLSGTAFFRPPAIPKKQNILLLKALWCCWNDDVFDPGHPAPCTTICLKPADGICVFYLGGGRNTHFFQMLPTFRHRFPPSLPATYAQVICSWRPKLTRHGIGVLGPAALDRQRREQHVGQLRGIVVWDSMGHGSDLMVFESSFRSVFWSQWHARTTVPRNRRSCQFGFCFQIIVEFVGCICESRKCSSRKKKACSQDTHPNFVHREDESEHRTECGLQVARVIFTLS